jgi:hypothetical protein
MGKGRPRAFLKDHLLQELGVIQLEQKPANNTDGSANKELLKKTFKMGLVNISGCDRCDQAIETASQVLCHSEALTILRSRHLGYHFFKPNIFANISIS